MIVNVIIICFILISGLIFYEEAGVYANSRYYRKRYIILICLILILQSGLRNVAVGADTYAYYEAFEKIRNTSWQQIGIAISDFYSPGIGKDVGYLVFQKIVQLIITNFQIYLFLIAILFFSALGNFIYKNTKRLADAIFAFVLYLSLFYAFFSITGIRQTIATAATLYGYELIKKRKLIPCLLLILLASTIHKSCLIFIPFYFIANLKNTKIIFGSTLFFFPFVFVFKNAVNDFLKEAGGYNQYEVFEGAGTYTFTFVLLIIAIVAFWRIKPSLMFNRNARPFYNAFAVAIFLTPLTFINPSSMRVVQYFSIFLLLLLPIVIQSFQWISLKMRRTVFGVAIFLLITLSIKGNWNSEYKFFWQQMELGDNYK